MGATDVFISRTQPAGYSRLARPLDAPELPGGQVRTAAGAAVRDLLRSAGLDQAHFSTPEWNPFGSFVAPGARIVVKPNWVLHENQAGAGLDCLVTHIDVVEAVLEYVALTRPTSVVLGDAPVQGCDFDRLLDACGVRAVVGRFCERGLPVALVDFRRTRPNAVLFDLGSDSLLDPITPAPGAFRVTKYNPEVLARTHGPGRHEYLVTRAVVEADLVVNLPKLKCHKKAAVTGALKNMVGIIASKDYLPHHRKGGARTGGDCYPEHSWLKARAEDLLDVANRDRAPAIRRMLFESAGLLTKLAGIGGVSTDLEGSWFGNDTVWRMCLDLQRIARYGRRDGTCAETPQREIFSIVDAIVAGEGDGPLAPTPLGMGLMIAGASTAAVDLVGARLMGFDPARIPLVREAFGAFRWPLTDFGPDAVVVHEASTSRPATTVGASAGRTLRAPEGWAGHCEFDEHGAAATE